MRVKAFVLVVIVVTVLIPVIASAQSQIQLSPATVAVGEPELYLTINGTGLAGDIDTVVVFDGGRLGTYSMPASSATSTELLVFVPIEVALTPGSWSVTVQVINTTGTITQGPAIFTVFQPVVQAPPLLNMPEVVLAEASGPSGANVSYSVTGFSYVDPAPTINCTPVSGSLFPLGPTTVDCTATDSFGTSNGSFLVFVGDTVPPVLTLPADITTVNPVVTFTVTATDAISGAVTPSCTPASGSTFPIGTTVVQCTAIDGHANYALGSFQVTVLPPNPPSLTLPADFSVEATGPGGAVVTYTATADQDAVVACTPQSGSLFPLGPTTVHCTATNAVGGQSTGSFVVTVTDTTPPVLTVPADITAEATGPNGAAVTFTVTATDLVDGSVTVTCTPASGATFPLGQTLVQCTATDAHHNTGTGSFKVNVVDTTPPQILDVKATPATLWPPDHKMVKVSVSVVAVDLVDPSPVSKIVSVSSSQPVNGTGDGDTEPDWEITGPLTLLLRAERAANVDRIYTITVSSTDFSGNSSTSTVQVKVTQSNRGRAAR